jgi:hypothetical protein
MMVKFQLLVGFAVLFDAPSVFSYVRTAEIPSLHIVAALKCPKKQYILQMTTSYQPDLDVRRKQSTGDSKISLNQINDSCLPGTEARNTYDRKVTA